MNFVRKELILKHGTFNYEEYLPHLIIYISGLINFHINYNKQQSSFSTMKKPRDFSFRTPKLSLIPEKSARFQSTELADIKQLENQSRIYNKIKSFVTRSIQKTDKRIRSEKPLRTNIKSYQVLVRSEQQKQLMQYLGPRILPVLVQSPSQKQKSKKKTKSHSVLDNILDDRSKFMKTYFADIKKHRKSGDQSEISYTFPEVRLGQWKINGYIKGKFILLRATKNGGKQIFKKYPYAEACKSIRKNYQKWVRDHFVGQIEEALYY